MNADRIAYAQLSRLTGTRDKRTARAAENAARGINAARHAATAYPGMMDGDTAAQLFALLTDTALAYQMEVEAELADPGPGQSLAAASGLSAKEALLTGLDENLDLKDENPGMAPVNGWLAWRTANGEDGPRP